MIKFRELQFLICLLLLFIIIKFFNISIKFYKVYKLVAKKYKVHYNSLKLLLKSIRTYREIKVFTDLTYFQNQCPQIILKSVSLEVLVDSLKTCTSRSFPQSSYPHLRQKNYKKNYFGKLKFLVAYVKSS